MNKTRQQETSSDAIPFIVYDQRDGFVLSKDAENYLCSLSDDRKVGVISIVGKYRTGKSFFVNRVLLERGKSEKGFQVGPTINPCTKGLWLWRKELKSSEDEDMDILLIDTEGFGGMDENVNHDSRIFLFSLLLSSYFIYNSQGSIDENALNSLSLIINLAKDIQINSKTGGMGGATSGDQANGQSNSSDDPANYFPSFLWVIRDFALQIVDQMGNKISQRDYLEKALELQKGVSDAIESKNRIRKLMKHFFKERDCNTLVRPVESEKELQNLDSMGNEDLRPEFNEQVAALRRKIFKKVKPKMLCGRTLNGRMLVEICKAYTEAINKGNLPNIENAWTYVKKCETQKAFDSSMSVLDQLLFEAQDTTIDPSQLEAFKEKMIAETRKVLKRSALGDEEDLKEYYKLIDEQAATKFREFKKQNKKQWQRKFSEMCGSEISELERKLNNEEYTDFWEFETELSRVKDTFIKALPGKDTNAEKYFSEVSERLYKIAAEKVHKKQEREQWKQLKQAESMLAIFERDTQRAKSELEENRNASQKIEQQSSQLKATISVQSTTLAQLQEQYAKTLAEFNQFKAQSQDELSSKEKEAGRKNRELEGSLESVKTEFLKKQAAYEKQIALLEQESAFNLRDNKSLMEKISLLEVENRKARQENTLHLSTIDRLKHQVDEQMERSNRDMDYVRSEFEKKVVEITSETDKKRDIIKQHSEFIIEKTYLENQVMFYKNQLEENKKLHDALLVALQCKKQLMILLNNIVIDRLNNVESMGKENESSSNSANNKELSETNRNLCSALEKSELRCRQLEEKNEKLKEFKNLFNNSSALQCAHCSKFLNSNIFAHHLNSCAAVVNAAASAGGPSSTSSSQMMTQSYLSQPADSNNNNNGGNAMQINLNPDLLVIEINQTMVKETPDNKPYTEYLILVSYQQWKWGVARKYKNFCELQQQLMAIFPNMKFPESSAAIINSSTDINNIFSTKRPTVIEDRRKALQQYLRDLARIDSVRNAKPYKTFLEVEKLIEQQKTARAYSATSSAGGAVLVPTFQANINDLKGSSSASSNEQYQMQNFMMKQSQQQQQQQSSQQFQQQQPLQSQQFMQQQQQQQLASYYQEPSEQQRKSNTSALTMSPNSFFKQWNEKQQQQQQQQPLQQMTASSTGNPIRKFHSSASQQF